MYGDMFESIKNGLYMSSFILVLDNPGIMMKENYLVSSSDLYGNIYCNSDIIKKIFEYDKNCVIKIGSRTSSNNIKTEYNTSNIHNVSKNSGCNEYYRFEYATKRKLLNKLMNNTYEPYINFSTCDGCIDIPINVKLLVSPKSYGNLNTPNSAITNHITKIFKSLCDKNINEQDKYIAFKMMAAFEKYISGQLKYDKYLGIIQNYGLHLYSIDIDDDEVGSGGTDTLLDCLRNVNIDDLSNFGISLLCNLYVSQSNEILKQYIYDILIFMTNEDRLARYISDNPSVLVHKEIKYDMSDILVDIKRLVNIYVNINKHDVNVYKIVDILDNLAKYLYCTNV